MSISGDVAPERQEILRLRARIVVLERSVLASLEIALRLRPEDLKRFLSMTRAGLARDYDNLAFAPDLVDEGERTFMAAEVERLLGGLQAEMGFSGGAVQPENG